MSHQPPPSNVSGDASLASALLSLVSLIFSFLNSSHVWLQNMTLIVSLAAGVFALSAWFYKFICWIKKIILK